MNKNIIIEKKVTLTAVFWDGSFKSVEAIEKADIFKDINVSFWEGHITYFDHPNFKLENCSRNRFLLRDGDKIKEYVDVTDIQNDYPEAIVQNVK